MHGFQLWVNLPATSKMIPPRYQGYDAHEIPQTDLANGGTLRVVAGEVMGIRGGVETTSPMTYAHATLEAGDVVEWTPGDGHTALVHVFDGELQANGHRGASGDMLVFERSAGTVRLTAGARAQALILGGQPLGEPVVRYGPFVMNSREEIIQAFRDYESGSLARSA
jgi:redox-sensitive bicupin YhaK (pirin superfamily)